MKTIRTKTKEEKRKRRQARIRAKVSGSAARPRLSVFRSNRHIFVQLIDDVARKTLASASDQELKAEKSEKGKKEKVDFAKVETSRAVGRLIAEKALAQKIKEVIFDRGGNRFTGRVKAVAEGAREGGLEF